MAEEFLGDPQAAGQDIPGADFAPHVPGEASIY